MKEELRVPNATLPYIDIAAPHAMSSFGCDVLNAASNALLQTRYILLRATGKIIGKRYKRSRARMQAGLAGV
jgi:hypothetical protein